MSDKKVVPEDAGLKNIVTAAGRTEQGRELLAYLARRCGFFDSGLMRLANGEVAPLATEVKAGQRQIWVELRLLMSVEMRHSIEELAEKVSVVQPQEERKK